MAFTSSLVGSQKQNLIKGLQNEDNKDNYVKISCEVNKFIYKNDKGFFVISSKLAVGSPNLMVNFNGINYSPHEFKIVGNSKFFVDMVKEKQEIEFEGFFELKDGNIQFNAKSLEEKIPTNPKAIEMFLSSGRIHGVGDKIAKKIVSKFGSETISILDTNHELLLEIDGINETKLSTIKKSWDTYRSVYEIIATMKMYGVGDSDGLKIYNHFKDKSLYIIKNDPYQLTEVDGIGFKTADKIALSIGIGHDDPQRIRSSISYVLKTVSEKMGHTVFPVDDLIRSINKELMVDNKKINDEINYLITFGALIFKDIELQRQVKQKTSQGIVVRYEKIKLSCVADKKIFNTEQRIAVEIKRITDFPNEIFLDESFHKKINEFIEKNNFNLDESQLMAANNILFNKFSILTGGPGTGKTHTIKSIINFYNTIDKKIILCAPTGRAAKRMEELSGFASSTIHRLLGFTDNHFTHDENNMLEGDLFIVDETSMNDVWITNVLLKAIPSKATVLFVGDVDQLPSVGAGNVLKDMIESEKIAVSRLSVIHRQALHSEIIKAAHSVVNNKMPKLFDEASNSDFIFIEKNGSEEIEEEILNLTKRLIEDDVKRTAIQILTPRKDIELGTNILNDKLKYILNPFFAEEVLIMEDSSKIKFSVGDRVMQFKNNYDLEIFNGDIGYITNINSIDGSVSINFDKESKIIGSSDLNNIKHAYASTIHKSQGSDYPVVIIPMASAHLMMWDSNLLYTAMTRGKNKVFLIGEKKVLFHAISYFKKNIRYTALKDSLINIYDNSKVIKPNIV